MVPRTEEVLAVHIEPRGADAGREVGVDAERGELASAPTGAFGRWIRCGAWSDRELVFAVPAVRDAAYSELYRRHASAVAAVARMVLGADAECDAVVNDVFAALSSAPEKFDPERGSLLGFLRLAARSRSIDHLRSESSRHRRERHDDHSPQVGVDAGFVAAEEDQILRRAVTDLPDIEQVVIELAYFAGMTYRSVAVHLSLPEGTVKSRMRAGLERLRTRVDASDFDIVETAVHSRGSESAGRR